MKIQFITGNKNKFAEAQKIISNLEQLDVDLPEIQEIDAKKVIEAKLQEAKNLFEGEFVVEDTSLYLNCLNGLPGPLIKWFEKTIGNNGIFDITQKYDNYRAQAKTIVGYIDEGGKISFFEGIIDGTIVKPQGENDFGWGPIFIPSGQNKTFAQMNQEEKNKISMRKIAFEKLTKHYHATQV
jgi:non-canonical purine NTP pyrophosphatase (RdgB/HAM1 family)